MLRFFLIALAAFGALTFSATAQSENTIPGFEAGGFLVVDQEQLFSRSLFGRAILSRTEAETQRLVAENSEIEEALIAEEKSLTEQRSELPIDEFGVLADAFDEKVQRIRLEQRTKNDRIATTLSEARRDFFQAIVPVLADILRENRAVAILDKRTVLLSVNLIDVTARAVTRIDERLGSGPPTTPDN